MDDFDDRLRFAAIRRDSPQHTAKFNVAKGFSGPLKTAQDCGSGSQVSGYQEAHQNKTESTTKARVAPAECWIVENTMLVNVPQQRAGEERCPAL